MRRYFYLALLSIVLVILAGPVHAQDLQSQILQQTKGVARDTYQTAQTTSPLSFVPIFVNATIGVLGVVAVLLIIYSGFLWMTAGGNEQQIEKAKSIIKRVIIGTIIITIAYAIVTFVVSSINNVGSPEIVTPSGK